MKQRTALIQIMNRLGLMAAALTSASFSVLAANQPPNFGTPCLGKFAEEKRNAFEPPGDGDWVLVACDAARDFRSARTSIILPP